jgi:DNA polymerase-3 subunit delta'
MSPDTKSDDEERTWPHPRANAELVGHDAAERTLKDAFHSGRLAHAWLITGPRGVGKATLAFRFARYVLARGRKNASPPGDLFGGAPAAEAPGLYLAPNDPVFRRVASGGHADLLTVERGFDEKRERRRSEVVVENVRGVGAFLSLTAAEGGWRVVVIDSADEMNRNAANAVLKVLEEPPARALLLLVSHTPERLLPTIRSRCQRLALKPLPESLVAARLEVHAPDLSAAEAGALARLAEGSIGRALALAEEGGLELYRELNGLLATLPNLDAAALHKLGDRVQRAEGEGAYRTLTELFTGWLGRLILRAAQGPAAPSATAEEAALIERLSAAASLERWLAAWDKVTRLLARADGANLDRKQVLLNVFFTVEGAARG